MSNIRNAYIDTSNYTDPNTKNSTDLVLWAEYAADKGWGYVYGTYGTVLSESMLTAKMEQYPDEVATKEQFITRSNTATASSPSIVPFRPAARSR